MDYLAEITKDISEKTFDLSRLKIEHIDDETLDGMNSLVKVNFSWNKIEKLTRNIFKTSKRIEELDLSDNKIANIEDETFKSLSKLAKLSLRCSFCFIYYFNSKRLSKLRERGHLPLLLNGK